MLGRVRVLAPLGPLGESAADCSLALFHQSRPSSTFLVSSYFRIPRLLRQHNGSDLGVNRSRAQFMRSCSMCNQRTWCNHPSFALQPSMLASDYFVNILCGAVIGGAVSGTKHAIWLTECRHFRRSWTGLCGKGESHSKAQAVGFRCRSIQYRGGSSATKGSA